MMNNEQMNQQMELMEQRLANWDLLKQDHQTQVQTLAEELTKVILDYLAYNKPIHSYLVHESIFEQASEALQSPKVAQSLIDTWKQEGLPEEELTKRIETISTHPAIKNIAIKSASTQHFLRPGDLSTISDLNLFTNIVTQEQFEVFWCEHFSAQYGIKEFLDRVGYPNVTTDVLKRFIETFLAVSFISEQASMAQSNAPVDNNSVELFTP